MITRTIERCHPVLSALVFVALGCDSGNESIGDVEDAGETSIPSDTTTSTSAGSSTGVSDATSTSGSTTGAVEDGCPPRDEGPAAEFEFAVRSPGGETLISLEITCQPGLVRTDGDLYTYSLESCVDVREGQAHGDVELSFLSTGSEPLIGDMPVRLRYATLSDQRWMALHVEEPLQRLLLVGIDAATVLPPHADPSQWFPSWQLEPQSAGCAELENDGTTSVSRAQLAVTDLDATENGSSTLIDGTRERTGDIESSFTVIADRVRSLVMPNCAECSTWDLHIGLMRENYS